MSNPELSELLSFLSVDVRQDLRSTALEYVLGLTGSQEGRGWIKTNKDIVECLLELLTDKNEIISNNTHLAVVNLSADQEIVKYLLNSIPQFLHHLQDPHWRDADNLCIILSNITRSVEGTEELFKVLMDAETGAAVRDHKEADIPTLYQLIDIFDRRKSYNINANFHHLASVFLNLTQTVGARQLFLDRSKHFLPRLLPYTQFSESHIRRRGITGLLNNLCFEVDHHKWLLNEEIDLLPSLLLPLAGPEQFDEEEMEKLPEDLQYLPENKQREEDPGIRKTLLQALKKLCCTKYGHDFLQEKQVYLILRELHRWEEDTEVKEACEDVVQFLIAR